MPTYKLKMPQSNQALDIHVLGIGTQHLTIALVNKSAIPDSISREMSLMRKSPPLEIIEISDDGRTNKTLKTPPLSFEKMAEDFNLEVYQLNFDSPQYFLNPTSTQQQTQLELRRANQNDRANIAKFLTSINDITFDIQKDKMRSANKNADAIRGLL